MRSFVYSKLIKLIKLIMLSYMYGPSWISLLSSTEDVVHRKLMSITPRDSIQLKHGDNLYQFQEYVRKLLLSFARHEMTFVRKKANASSIPPYPTFSSDTYSLVEKARTL